MSDFVAHDHAYGAVIQVPRSAPLIHWNVENRGQKVWKDFLTDKTYPLRLRSLDTDTNLDTWALMSLSPSPPLHFALTFRT